MYELIQVGEHTYYIDCPSKIGIYVTNDNHAYLIDSGNDKSAGKKVKKNLRKPPMEFAGDHQYSLPCRPYRR